MRVSRGCQMGRHARLCRCPIPMETELMTKLMRNMAMAAGLALASGLSAPAWAEVPTRAMTIVVPFSPGGGTDTLSRLVAERLTDRFRSEERRVGTELKSMWVG